MADFAVLAGQWLDMYADVVMPTDPGTEHLTAHWPLDGTYQDLTGHGYDAVAGSAVVFDTGHLGQSAYFNGNNYVSYLECQNSTGMNLTGGATVSAWIKTPGLVDAYASVVTKGLQAWRLIRNNTAGSISFHFNASTTGEYQANGTTSITDNQWHHLMVFMTAAWFGSMSMENWMHGGRQGLSKRPPIRSISAAVSAGPPTGTGTAGLMMCGFMIRH
jgi:hypothetical protein